jgi:hypothetical protein
MVEWRGDRYWWSDGSFSDDLDLVVELDICPQNYTILVDAITIMWVRSASNIGVVLGGWSWDTLPGHG